MVKDTTQGGMNELLKRISGCTDCLPHLPHGVRPVVAADSASKLVVIGQAPGRIVHETGIPWNDQSGDNLRRWLGVDKETFYDASKVALVPMGFCFPGTGTSGDLPPRKECAARWHEPLRNLIEQPRLTLLVGGYAQKAYLGSHAKVNLTQTVRHFNEYQPTFFPLPHPSPRNNIWMAKNPWFKEEVLPELQAAIRHIL